MSILIKNMEMPKDERYVDVRIFADGSATTATGEHPFYREMKVIELPSHGRLIDADMLTTVTEMVDGKWKTYIEVFEVEDAPTVIESEYEK